MDTLFGKPAVEGGGVKENGYGEIDPQHTQGHTVDRAVDAGKSCKILGHIGMTHTVLDVSDVPCNVGDEVVFDVNPIYISANIPREYI